MVVVRYAEHSKARFGGVSPQVLHTVSGMALVGEAAHRHSAQANGSYTASRKALSANYAAATSNPASSAQWRVASQAVRQTA